MNRATKKAYKKSGFAKMNAFSLPGVEGFVNRIAH